MPCQSTSMAAETIEHVLNMSCFALWFRMRSRVQNVPCSLKSEWIDVMIYFHMYASLFIKWYQNSKAFLKLNVLLISYLVLEKTQTQRLACRERLCSSKFWNLLDEYVLNLCTYLQSYAGLDASTGRCRDILMYHLPNKDEYWQWYIKTDVEISEDIRNGDIPVSIKQSITTKFITARRSYSSFQSYNKIWIK